MREASKTKELNFTVFLLKKNKIQVIGKTGKAVSKEFVTTVGAIRFHDCT